MASAKMPDMPPTESDAVPLQTSTDAIAYDLSSSAALDDSISGQLPGIADAMRMIVLVKRGDELVHELYSYRSLQTALGQAKAIDADRKASFSLAVGHMLWTHAVEKLVRVQEWVAEAIATFCELAKPIAHGDADRSMSAQELSRSSLLALLDTLVIIDFVKKSKPCLQNDFSFYRRTVAELQSPSVREQLAELGEDSNIDEICISGEAQLQMQEFLANSFLPPSEGTRLLPTVVGKIKDIPHFELVISHLLNFAASQYEQQKYLLPREKWSWLRSMCVCLMVLGWHDDSTYTEKAAKKVFSSDINFDSVQQHLVRYPVIPLVADMQISPVQLLEQSPWFKKLIDAGKLTAFQLPTKATDKVLKEYLKAHDLGEQMPAVRAHFDSYCARLCALLATTKQTLARGQAVQEGVGTRVKDFLLTGLRLLSKWSEMVLKLVAWKYARPSQADAAATAGKTPLMYELAVSLNYSKEEKDHLVDMIGYIKGLGRILKRAEQAVGPLLRTVMHREAQEIVQHVLTDSVLRSDKKGRLKDRIKLLQDLVGDWDGGIPPIEEPVHTKRLLWSNGIEGPRSIPERFVASTRTQTVMMRAVLQSFLDEKAVKDRDEKSIQDFLRSSFYFDYLLKFSSTIDSCADTGDLWYREYYLEMSKQMSTQDQEIVQFPIKMSLPWILIDHVVNSPNRARMENVLFPLDIYNDAAQRALTVLKKQYIFDEVQAELNLCFDQVVFLLSEQVYKYFKLQASSQQMDKRQRTMLTQQQGQSGRTHLNHIPTCASSIEKICAVRNLTLLGRTVDLNNLVTQRVHKFIMKNIESAISKFESSGLQHIKELDLLLENIRITHSLLSAHLQLDSFESMLKENNDDISVASFQGRIAVCALSELISDLLPNWVYNSGTRRFVPQPGGASPKRASYRMQPIDLYGSPAMSKYMQQASKLFAGFFGVEHVESLIRVLGSDNMPLIVYQLMKNLDMSVTNVLGPYIKALTEGFPDRTMPIKDLIAMRSRLDAKMFLPTMFQVSRRIISPSRRERDLVVAIEHPACSTVPQRRTTVPLLPSVGVLNIAAGHPQISGHETSRLPDHTGVGQLHRVHAAAGQCFNHSRDVCVAAVRTVRRHRRGAAVRGFLPVPHRLKLLRPPHRGPLRSRQTGLVVVGLIRGRPSLGQGATAEMI